MQKHNRKCKWIPLLVDICVDSVVANIKQYESLGGLCDTYAISLLLVISKSLRFLC